MQIDMQNKIILITRIFFRIETSFEFNFYEICLIITPFIGNNMISQITFNIDK